MAAATKRKTSLTLDVEVLNVAKELVINVSAVAENALIHTAVAARRKKWLAENADLRGYRPDLSGLEPHKK